MLLETERGSTRPLYIENSLGRKLETWRKADHRMNE